MSVSFLKTYPPGTPLVFTLYGRARVVLLAEPFTGRFGRQHRSGDSLVVYTDPDSGVTRSEYASYFVPGRVFVSLVHPGYTCPLSGQELGRREGIRLDDGTRVAEGYGFRCYCTGPDGECGRMVRETMTVSTRNGNRDWCADCLDTVDPDSCEHCGQYCTADMLWNVCRYCGNVCTECQHELYYCGVCTSYGCEECNCNDESDYHASGYRNGRGNLHSYNYTPSPLVFRGDGPAFLGLELEINASSSQADFFSPHADLIYCKEDSSVSGFEIVTHPMTYEWALANFPWQTLRTLYDDGARAGNNGIHVHISRNAFETESHVLKWLLLAYRNNRNVSKLARRVSDQWASFNDSDEIVEKAKGDRDGRRYSAINCQNHATFEMRVFASSLNPEKVQAALGYVAASWHYTRELSAAQALAGGLSWQAFAAWVADRPIYAPLYAQMEKQGALPVPSLFEVSGDDDAMDIDVGACFEALNPNTVHYL